MELGDVRILIIDARDKGQCPNANPVYGMNSVWVNQHNGRASDRKNYSGRGAVIRNGLQLSI